MEVDLQIIPTYSPDASTIIIVFSNRLQYPIDNEALAYALREYADMIDSGILDGEPN